METTVPFFSGCNYHSYQRPQTIGPFFSGRNYYVKIGFGGNVTTGKKKHTVAGQLCFSAGSNYNRKKLRPEKKTVQLSGRQLETGKN